MTDENDMSGPRQSADTEVAAQQGADGHSSQAPEIPKTGDGIPLVVNGVPLNETQITALREARARRAEIDARATVPREIDGAERAEATRYGDWEKAGRAIDFS